MDLPSLLQPVYSVATMVIIAFKSKLIFTTSSLFFQGVAVPNFVALATNTTNEVLPASLRMTVTQLPTSIRTAAKISVYSHTLIQAMINTNLTAIASELTDFAALFEFMVFCS